MAHYIGPKHKLARREGVNVLDKASASLMRRLATPPGFHGRRRTTKRLSEFGIQLREKQKLKAVYGVMERQLSTLVKAAEKKKGETGEVLIASLETRLDNMVYRLGFANSRFMARQLVSHGHILVNDKKLTIPSYVAKPGDIIAISPKMHKNVQVVKLAEDKEKELPAFLKREGLSGRLLRLPIRSDVTVPFDTQLIIEYYSR